MKKGLTLLNLLILVSLFILPNIIVLTANNVAGVANSIKLAEPTPTFKDGVLTLSSILTIRNPGPFKIEAGITGTAKDDQGTQIGVTSTQLQVKTGTEEQKIPVNLVIDLTTLSEKDGTRLASNPENITIEASAHVGIQPITTLTAEATAQVNWLPPMSNLTVGQPILRDANKKQVTVEVPFSFENQSPFFGFEGDGVISVFNSSNQQVGGGVLKVQSQPSTKWSDSAKIVLSLPASADYLLLRDATFRYRVEEAFTLKGFPITTRMNQNITIDWGAPISNRQISTSYSPINSTHIRVLTTLSFLNNNRFITADGSVTPRLVNDSGQSWVGTTQPLKVAPGGTATLNFDVIIPNSLLISGNPRLVLGVDTQIGSIDLEANSLG
jgi:hypothetical protein